jgi:beta-galactosidase
VLFLSSFTRGGERVTLNFNPDWKFIRDDPARAQEPGFDDHAWANISTPHTFNDTDTFDDWSLSNHRGEQHQWSGRVWYRKSFKAPESWKEKKVFIEFEAARQVAEVYLNGRFLGVSKTGFTPFGFDLTPNLRFDGMNVLAVMCDNRFVSDPAPNGGSEGNSNGNGPSLSQIAARVNEALPEDVDQVTANQLPWNNPHWHPAHGGIYRNVRLYVLDPFHISLPLYSFLRTAGPYVYATNLTDASATTTVEVPVQNDRPTPEKIEVTADFLNAEGQRVLSLTNSAEVKSNQRTQLLLSGAFPKPKLWEPAYPYLYRVIVSLRIAGTAIDTSELPFGIRNPRWDARRGFALNGRSLKLHGWGQKPTDEWPGLGAAQPDWMHFYTLSLMKEAGGNFVRWGHSAAGPASITAADRLGIITDQPGVDGESDTRGAAWKLRASAFRDVVIYFRNNPSILIWEGGNQKVTHDHARELRGLMDKYDLHGGRAYTYRRADEIDAEFMDICLGTEGSREITRLPVVEGEYDREESPRRVWDSFSPPNFGYPEAKGMTYQLTSEEFAVNEVREFVLKVGAVDHCGGANWIFSDSTSGGRVPCEVARASGEVDGVRLPKEAYYACRAMFRDDPQVQILGHWNYPAETRKTVYVVSNREEVELFVNNKRLGRVAAKDRYLFTFPNVGWEAGEIKAVAYAQGKAVATQSKRTSGPAVALRLTPITGPNGFQAEGSDVALIDVEAVDADGNRCPTFQKRVDFDAQGPAIWRGGYNSGRTNSINNPLLDLECGINRVALRSSRTAGKVTLLARCEGLRPASLTLDLKSFDAENGCSTSLPAMPSVTLPMVRPVQVAAPELTAPSPAAAISGRYTKTFSYSGPTTNVHLEENAQRQKPVYLDRTYAFKALPDELLGADWVQAANADKLYSAVDLMQLSVESGAVVSVAHDDRVPRPVWLKQQFKQTRLSLEVEGKPMSIFQHRADRTESLTLGSNTESASVKACNMYVVFIGRVSASAATARAAGLQEATLKTE